MAARRGIKLLAFFGAYLKTNVAAMLEYRASSFLMILGMMVNDVLWVAFWALYFTKFPVVKGWTLEDVLVLWSSVGVSLGISMGFFANSLRIPQLVVQGQLDYYLTLPKDPLLHLLVSQVAPLSFGDLIFGPLLLILFVHLTWVRAVIFLATALLASLLLLGFFILSGSLVFYLGNAETLGGQLFNTLVHFATYPSPIFDTTVKVILFTVIPAGFVSTLPVELVREFHWTGFLELLGAALFFFGLAVLVFRRGLYRYESGNLMQMRA